MNHLNGHRAHDSALMALQRLQRDLSNLRFVLTEEELASVQQHFLVLALDLHLVHQKRKKRPFQPRARKTRSDIRTKVLSTESRPAPGEQRQCMDEAPHLSNANDRDRDALAGVNSGAFNLKRHSVQAQPSNEVTARQPGHPESRTNTGRHAVSTSPWHGVLIFNRKKSNRL